MTRQERVLQLPFFENKRELAEQVLKMERELSQKEGRRMNQQSWQ